MQIRDSVLDRSRLMDRGAAALLEVIYTVTSHEKSPGAIVGAHPIRFGDRRQHRLFGFVERLAPRFGAVTTPRDEDDGGRTLAPALHVNLSAPADIDQAREILVMVGAALNEVALGGVV